MRLICYPTSGAAPKLAPAPVERDWMERTNAGFAYRCLPLNIANAHGWLILNAAPFVAEWDGGTRMELEAFNDFVLGRPKIDRITYKNVEDSNTNLAAVLAGEVDLCMRSTVSFDGAMILRDQWEKQGKGKVLISPASWSWLNLSRDNPWFNDVRVRRALLHAIDRDAIVRSLVPTATQF